MTVVARDSVLLGCVCCAIRTCTAMAAVSNAFNLLHGSDAGAKGSATDDAWSVAGGSKKKRKGKAKDGQRPADIISPASSQNGLQVQWGTSLALPVTSCFFIDQHLQTLQNHACTCSTILPAPDPHCFRKYELSRLCNVAVQPLACATQAPPSLANSAASIADHTEQQNGHIDEPHDDGFQAAGRRGAVRGGSRAGRSAAAGAGNNGALMPEAEAAELLKSAAQSVSGDRLRLWQEWARQVGWPDPCCISSCLRSVLFGGLHALCVGLKLTFDTCLQPCAACRDKGRQGSVLCRRQRPHHQLRAGAALMVHECVS